MWLLPRRRRILPLPDRMFEFAHFVDRFLQVAAPYLITLAVLLWAVAFGKAALDAGTQPRRSRLFVGAATGFLAIVLSLCGAMVFLTHAAVDELRPRLNAQVTEM